MEQQYPVDLGREETWLIPPIEPTHEVTLTPQDNDVSPIVTALIARYEAHMKENQESGNFLGNLAVSIAIMQGNAEARFRARPHTISPEFFIQAATIFESQHAR